MSDERWTVQVESPWVYDVWYHIGPLYVSEEIARLAIKYHWTDSGPVRIFRVRRVA